MNKVPARPLERIQVGAIVRYVRVACECTYCSMATGAALEAVIFKNIYIGW